MAKDKGNYISVHVPCPIEKKETLVDVLDTVIGMTVKAITKEDIESALQQALAVYYPDKYGEIRSIVANLLIRVSDRRDRERETFKEHLEDASAENPRTYSTYSEGYTDACNMLLKEMGDVFGGVLPGVMRLVELDDSKESIEEELRTAG